jgi:4-hydroxy-3-polyprenylbenzoate decarboxylase
VTDTCIAEVPANTDPQRVCPQKPLRSRNSIFTKGRADALDHATSEMAIGSKLGVDATKKLPGEGFKRPATAHQDG